MEVHRQAKLDVLVVDDDPVVRGALVRVLSGLNYRPIPAATVAEGQAQLGDQAFAILDLNLPDGVGTTILSRIRYEHLNVRVAVCSGTTDEALLAEAAELHPDLMLHKPIDLTALLEWLSASHP